MRLFSPPCAPAWWWQPWGRPARERWPSSASHPRWCPRRRRWAPGSGGGPPASPERRLDDAEGRMSRPGLVSLVGAGPGDPELLTLRAVARLRAADVVLYDALVDRAALRHAPQARWGYVGKRAGRHSISQETIERIMIRRALRGERVVRLKSGDPFVFGRGGEEALALAAAGVPCEVVPGISAAVAGPALAGIPVTHRGTVSAFLVVSGHAETAFAPALGSLAPGAATVVVLRGIATRAATVALLLSRGWKPQTRAAVLLSA